MFLPVLSVAVEVITDWPPFSGLLIIASAVTLFTQGLHLGIEFKGGSSFIVTSSSASVANAESALTEAGITSQTIIQKIGNDKVRVQTNALTQVEQTAVEDKLAAKFGVSVDSIDSQIIGPSWGEDGWLSEHEKEQLLADMEDTINAVEEKAKERMGDLQIEIEEIKTKL